MMYVLTQRVKVATENGEELYHYHPLVGECLLIPGAKKNQMVCSGNLLELQAMQKNERLSQMCGMCEDFRILALKPDEFELLQLLLDETITAIIDNTHKAVEALLLNEAYMGIESISCVIFFLLAINVHDGNILSVRIVHGILCSAGRSVPYGDNPCRVIDHPFVSDLIHTSPITVTDISRQIGCLYDGVVPLTPLRPTVNEIRMWVRCD